jgi:hypothetical protein
MSYSNGNLGRASNPLLVLVHALWYISLCNLADIYGHFRYSYSFLNQDDDTHSPNDEAVSTSETSVSFYETTPHPIRQSSYSPHCEREISHCYFRSLSYEFDHRKVNTNIICATLKR